MSRVNDDANVLAFPQAAEGIELRHLRAFVAVAEELNFGRAAERLYITQPALSRQIRALEQLLGCELLRRSTHRVELTIAGEALLNRVRPVLREVDATVSAVQSLGGELVERVAKLWQPLVQAAATDADVQEQRMAYEKLLANFAVPPEVEVRPVTANGVSSLLVARQPDDPPRLLHLHGGGYVIGSAFGYRPLAGALSLAADTGVLVPDYRLAPEHPFPAALGDALDATRAVDADVVAGDSAGGNLAAVVARHLKDRLKLQLLIYPVTDAGINTPSYRELDERFGLTAASMRRFWNLYLDGADGNHPDASPVRAPDLAGVAPAFVLTAEVDVLRDEGEAYAAALRDAGVPVELVRWPGTIHGFFRWLAVASAAREAVAAVGGALRDALSVRTTAA
jgi:monoterpene epsilon-lactone hydrolase